MFYYLKFVVIGFVVFAVTSYVLVALVSVVPWESQQLEWMAEYFTICGALLTCLPFVFRDVFTRRRLWANQLVRAVSVPFIGATIGLLVLGWIATLRNNYLADLRGHGIDKLLNGCPDSFWPQAQRLWAQAELLTIVRMFVENCMQYAVGFAAIAMVVVWLYDSFKPRWLTISLATGFALTFPFYLGGLVGRYYPLTPPLPAVMMSVIDWMFASVVVGSFLVGFVWSIRDGNVEARKN